MGAILQKKQMSEEDIKLQYITPFHSFQVESGEDHHGNPHHGWKDQSEGQFCVPRKAQTGGLYSVS